MDALEWVANAVVDVGTWVTGAIGTFDALFADRVNFNISVYPQNPDPDFSNASSASSSEMIESWGTQEGKPLD